MGVNVSFISEAVISESRIGIQLLAFWSDLVCVFWSPLQYVVLIHKLFIPSFLHPNPCISIGIPHTSDAEACPLIAISAVNAIVAVVHVPAITGLIGYLG